MSVLYSALRFICTYVFTAFSLWVCTYIYIYIYIYRNRYQLSLSFTLHSSIFLSGFLYITPNHPISLSLSKYWRLHRQVEWGKWGNIYVFMCACVSHWVWNMEQSLTFAQNLWQDDQTLWTHDTSPTNMQVMAVLQSFQFSATQMGSITHDMWKELHWYKKKKHVTKMTGEWTDLS